MPELSLTHRIKGGFRNLLPRVIGLNARTAQYNRVRADLLALQMQVAELQRNITTRLDDVQVRRNLAAGFRGDYYRSDARHQTVAEYWSKHNVTGHRQFESATESLDYFDQRNLQYPGYIGLLPVTGWDGKVVIDYGCGPGNDLVGFAHYSRPERLLGVDVSPASLREAAARLALHDRRAELIHLPHGVYALPLESGSVDYIHCSGVLMLVEDPLRLLREFRRVLKPSGELRLMVYNYDSLWLHLYVAYVVRLENGLYADVDIRDAFSRTTDGEDCPLVRVWRPSEMAEMAASTGFECAYLGAAMSLWELHLMPLRFRAMLDPRLERESREFLLALELDRRGFPLYRGNYAGIDACYRFTPCETKAQ